MTPEVVKICISCKRTSGSSQTPHIDTIDHVGQDAEGVRAGLCEDCTSLIMAHYHSRGAEVGKAGFVIPELIKRGYRVRQQRKNTLSLQAARMRAGMYKDFDKLL